MFYLHLLFTDPDVVRHVQFRAHYAVDCSILSNPVSRATLASLAESNFKDIQSVCDKGELFYISILYVHVSYNSNFTRVDNCKVQGGRLLT